jgi:phospholipase C
MFLLTWDDWGGWYDHVPPPQIDADGYGFRVPGIIVSPYAERGRIDSTTYDFSSILRFIEENWNIEPLTARDATANSLGGALNFAATPREPRFPGPVYPDKPDIEARNRTALTIVYGAVGIAVVALFLLFARWRSPLRRTAPRAGTDA